MEEENNNKIVFRKDRPSQPYKDITAVKQKHNSTFPSKSFIHKLDKNSLPLKKRCHGVLTKTAILTFNLDRVKKTEDVVLKTENNKKGEVMVVPGVIRHTSCPDNFLAYYLNYDK